MSKDTLDKEYSHKDVGERWYRLWEERGYSNTAHPWRDDRYS